MKAARLKFNFESLQEMGVPMRVSIIALSLLWLVACSQPETVETSEPPSRIGRQDISLGDDQDRAAHLEMLFSADALLATAASAEATISQKIAACEKAQGLHVDNISCKQTICRLEVSFQSSETHAVNALMRECQLARSANLLRADYVRRSTSESGSVGRFFVWHQMEAR